MNSSALIVARRALRCGSASASANTPTRQIIGSFSSALSQSCRCMSITSQYEKGLGLLNRLPQKQPAALNPGPLVTNGANTLNAKGSGKTTANSNDATANAGQAGADTNLPAVVPQQTAVAEQPAADDVSLLGSTPKQIAEQVAHDLERQGAVHMATMQAMERSKEWRDYDGHVNFELNLLRARYAAAGEPMTSQRRSQMAAHLKAKQMEVMEEHAEAAAEQFVSSLTQSELEEMRTRLRRLDASVPLESVNPSKSKGSIYDDEFKSALEHLSSVLSDAESAGMDISKIVGGGAGAPASPQSATSSSGRPAWASPTAPRSNSKPGSGGKR